MSATSSTSALQTRRFAAKDLLIRMQQPSLLAIYQKKTPDHAGNVETLEA